jgi:hypothetical protein
VPRAVPSVTQGSQPRCAVSAKKTRRPATTPSGCGAAAEGEPAQSFLIRTVPRSVPSVLHSAPPLPSAAPKKTPPRNAVRPMGDELPSGHRSVTRLVPAGVPSLVHSSVPRKPSSAAK